MSLPAEAKPITFAPLACACSRYDEKSVVSGKGYAARPTTVPPVERTKAAASRSSCWPNT